MITLHSRVGPGSLPGRPAAEAKSHSPRANRVAARNIGMGNELNGEDFKGTAGHNSGEVAAAAWGHSNPS